MNICDFQKKVIKHFKSESLKKAIITSNTQFSAIELCKIIFVYVEEYEDRLCLLKEMLSVVSDNDMPARYEQTLLTVETLRFFGYGSLVKTEFLKGEHCFYVKKRDESGESMLGKMVFDFIEWVRKKQ